MGIEREEISFRDGRCPDCRGQLFHPGPKGGMAVNVLCAACGSTFNYCGQLLPSHRIPLVPGVYKSERRSLSEIGNDPEELARSMRRTLRLMETMGVPKRTLVDVLELCASEIRKELQLAPGKH